jgi:hypothetical protein
MPHSHNDSVADGPYVSGLGRLDNNHPGEVDRIAILCTAVQLSGTAVVSERFHPNITASLERFKLVGTRVCSSAARLAHQAANCSRL